MTATLHIAAVTNHTKASTSIITTLITRIEVATEHVVDVTAYVEAVTVYMHHFGPTSTVH